MRRLALSLTLIAAGAAMFAASAHTGDSAKNGGIFRYGTTAASVQLDRSSAASRPPGGSSTPSR
jgi:hypothetical protein